MESKTVLEQMAEMYEKEGFQKGFQEGFQEGFQKGFQEGRAKAILDILARRFGSVSSEVRQAINRIYDEPVLDSYFNLALDCPSLDEFENDLLSHELIA